MTERVTWVSTDIQINNGWQIVSYEITDAFGREYFQHLKCDTKIGAKQAIQEMKRDNKNVNKRTLSALR